eukprot:TRINITY_DN1875_c2_g2_i1.p1 TRINITY_DN1875_c2_g2~~TRINITY_DN1875_c2_g2_i1.p1  ORF type:complete len:854 (+),score=129.76 TRINITY_DN1875_c2_g2_i1:59-2620(+)
MSGEGCDFDEIDAETLAHFKFLQKSMGQNFSSVLNNPLAEKVSWTTSAWNIFDKSNQGDAPAKLSKIPPPSMEPIKQYIRSIGANYKEWKLSKRDIPKPTSSSSDKVGENNDLTIPSEFYRKQFSLIDNLDVAQQVLADCDPFSSQLFASKLQYYQTEVDQRLFSQVKQRSPQFFTALNNFMELKVQVASAVDDIGTLRKRIASVKQYQIDTSLTIFKQKRRQRNQQRLQEVLSNIKTLQAAGKRIKAKQEDGKYIEAAAHLQEGGVGELVPYLDKLACLRHLKTSFDSVKSDSIRAIHNELLKLLLVDDNNMTWPATDEWVATLKSLLEPLILQGIPKVKNVLKSYQKGVFEEVKATVTQTLTKVLRSQTKKPMSEEDLLKPARLRAAPAQDFREVLDHLFTAAYLLYRKTHFICSSIETIVTEAPITPLDKQALIETLSEAKNGVVRRIQARMGRMYEIRKDEHVTLSFREIHSLLKLAFDFMNRLEAIAGDSTGATASFRATIITQAKDFFNKQHEKQQQKILVILHSELWQMETDVDVSFQEFCSRMTDSSPESVAKAKSLAIDSPDSSPLPEVSDSMGSSPKLVLAGKSYGISHSILMLMQMLSDYELYVSTMPFLATEVTQRIHELLKVYDGQVSMLILGAGARETAGIETITVSHLAVSAQCLSFLSEFAVHVQARLELVLPKKGQAFLKQLTRFSKEAANHRNEFYVKVVLMVKENMRAWKTGSDWQTTGTQWINSLLKDIGRIIKKGLERIMEKSQLRVVVYPILYFYFVQIRDVVRSVKRSPDPAVAEKLKEDILYYKVNIENFGFSVMISSVARDFTASEEWLPTTDEQPDSDEEVLDLFLG